MKNRNKNSSIFSLIFACLIYGFFPILVRTIGYKIPIFYQNWTRTLLEFFILMIPVAYYKKWIKIKVKDYGILVIRAIGGLIGFIAGYYSFLYLPIGSAFFIFYVGSLSGGFILGKIMFQEKMTKLKWFSFLIGMIGLYFVYSFSIKANEILPVLAAVASGLGTALWNISSKKISGRYSALQLNVVDVALYGIMVFFISLWIKEPWTHPVVNIAWFASLLLAISLIITGQLMVIGFKNIEGQLGSLIMMLEVVFGILFGFTFYREIVSIRTLFGGGLILFALILSQSKFKNKLLR